MAAGPLGPLGRGIEWHECIESLESLERGATVVTATPRLARHLAHEYTRHQRARGVEVWDSPDILTWDAWMGRVLRELGGEQAPVVLNDAQELALWEQVIADDLARAPTDQAALWQHGPASRAARRAHHTFHQWRMQDMSRDAIGDDARAFLRWQQAFEHRCRARGHLVGAMVGTCLLTRLDALRERPPAAPHERPPALPETLIVAGFAAHVPLQEQMFTALTVLGVRVVPMTMPAVDATAVRCRAADPEDELHRAASWCRQKLLDAGRADAGKGLPTLGVVINNLGDERRDMAARIFEQVLGGYDPALDSVRTARLFHLSPGAPLARYPVVAAALEWLEWLSGGAAYETFSRSVRSPFIHGADAEWAARGRLDRELRDVVPARVTPAVLRSALNLKRVKDALPPDLGARLHKLLAVSTAADRPRSPAAWSVTFSEWLAIAGWPGERALNSHEHQTLTVWNEVLERCASLNLVELPCDARRAWLALMRIASGRVFNPEAVPAPVQALGVEEVTGLTFDALWVTGLSDDDWPPPPMPIPFLPVAEQRRLRMPESSWDVSLNLARDTIARLTVSASEVVFSYPEKEDDRELQVSPLVRDVRDASADEWPGGIMRSPDHLGAALGEMESVFDGNGPALAGDDRSVRGGATLFADQAACPFRAFAVHRLKSKTISSARAALNVMDHGSMVHGVLERLWEGWRTQAHLLAESPEQVRARVVAAIDETLTRYQRENPDVMSRASRVLQHDRLLALVRAHLAFESARPPFTVVAREQALERDVHGVRVRVRMDRIDEMADGKQLLIDYKTGDAKPSAWFGEHPDAPQLPLYRVLLGDRVAGVAFARVRRGETGKSYLAGLCDETVTDAMGLGLGLVSSSRAARKYEIADWAGLVEHWDMVFKRLARAIAAGEAVVSPQPLACEYCDQQTLCRIAERKASSDTVEDGVADAERHDAG